MRSAAVALLLVLVGVWASGSALARKGGGHQGGGKPHGGGHAHAGGKHFTGHHHHGHHRHGHHHHHKGAVAFVGYGFAYPWYPPYYYPYYAQPVAYPQPVTYIEQGGAPAAQPAGWWYYCGSARAYYPYVNECPSGWQRVPAIPPPPN